MKKSKNQIKVLVEKLRIRKNSDITSEIVGMSIKDNVYNYYEIVKNSNYEWYKIGENQWIANNGKYLEIIPKEINYKEEYELIYNEYVKLNKYKFIYTVSKTGIYKIKLNEKEQLIIK